MRLKHDETGNYLIDDNGNEVACIYEMAVAEQIINALAGDWRAIETAPTGETLIGWAPCWLSPELIYRDDESSPWQEGGAGGDYVDLGYEPTHWRPLPPPPDWRFE